jgi:hypothetical protein
MKQRWRSGSGLRRYDDPDLQGALDAMTAEELRSFVRDALEQLDDEPRGELVDRLIARASKGSSRWRPSGPSREIIDEVTRFAKAARLIGQANPEEVDAYLRQGTKAFLAGDHATARGVFEALLPPVADCEIDLGQHELVDEVLTVNEHECAVQYVTCVYTTTPMKNRAEALCQAINVLEGVTSLWEPLAEMERAAGGPLAELGDFLPRWVRYLEQRLSSKSEWEGDHDRWLREAVLRLEGVKGVERIARKTKKPEALDAWCAALADQGEWAEALRAYDDAAEMTGKSDWRGVFLDGAAFAAQQLGRRDATKRLEAAWLGAPSLERLLRRLGAGNPAAATLSKRITSALKHCPVKAARQRSLLHFLNGDAPAAAKLLAKAPGLGWSSEDHPGHVLFPAFANLLAGGRRARLSSELFSRLRDAPRDPFDLDWDSCNRTKPNLATPSIAALIELARPGANIDSRGSASMLEAMQSAATKRVAGILGNKRRRHYDHAATLVACCLELAPFVGKQEVVSDWVASLRKQYSRFYAFQAELKSALAASSS